MLAEVEMILFFGAAALVGNWIAWSKGFYILQDSKASKAAGIDGRTVLAVFAIYLGTMLLLAPLLSKVAYLLAGSQKYSIAAQPATLVGWLQLFTIALTLFFLFFFCRTRDLSAMKKIWKDYSRPHTDSIAYDFGIGMLTWLISFPVAALVGQLSDMLLFYFLGIENYEQVAVRYLKTALSSPSLLFIALSTILISAPVIEEFLFRGVLQTWFKRYLGRGAAILLSALCFALFHLAPSQGAGNISLGLSLFSFGCFLGFLYEKQGSLFATIGLHMTFNSISTFRILFMPE